MVDKTKMTDEDILADLNKNLERFFVSTNNQRKEIRQSFSYMNNHIRQEETNLKTDSANISLLPAIVRGVACSEVLEERSIRIIPNDNEEYDIDADIMDDAVTYAQYAGLWKNNYDIAKRNTAICGLGATVTNLDMTKKIAVSGIPKCRSIHSSLVFYDTSGNGKEINDTANWCGYVDIMSNEDLIEYVKEKTGDKDFTSQAGGSEFNNRFLEGFSKEIYDADLLYHYFYRENEPVHDTENPLFSNDEFKQLISQDDIATELLSGWTDSANVRLDASYWVLEPKQYRELKDTVKAINELSGGDYECKSSKRMIKAYYKCEVGLGVILSKSRSFSQNEFPLQFITGYYDEEYGSFYGLVRPLSFVQDALDDVMSNLLDYADTAAHGGAVYAQGAADDIKTLKKSQANKDKLTPISASTTITSKQLASSPQVLLETARLLIELMPRAIGVGQEFLGVMTSGDMTDSLFGRIIRQSFAVLEDFTANSANYCQRQGQVFIDLMESVAKVEDGRLLPILSPNHTEQDYFQLSRQNIARSYALKVVERPVSLDEKKETLKMLVQLYPQMQQSGKDISPAIIDALPMDYTEREKLSKLTTPTPPAVNPDEVAMMKANTRLINAQAAQLESAAQENQSTMPLNADKMQSEIDKNLASAAKSSADAQAKGKETTLKEDDLKIKYMNK